MNRWVERLLRPLHSVANGVVVVLDPDEVVDAVQINGEVAEIRDWWSLRAAYEGGGRRRPDAAGPLILVVRGPSAAQPLPWDIEHTSGAVIPVRLPGPPAVRRVLAKLTGDEAEHAIAAVATGAEPEKDLLSSITGIALSAQPLARADQFRVAARLAVLIDPPPELLELARRWVVEPTVSGLLATPADASRLQEEWTRFASGERTDGAVPFGGGTAELGQLFAVGILQPVTARASLPAWAAPGVRSPSSEERAEELLTQQPSPFPPTDQAGWSSVAGWWGDVRRLIAGAPTDLRQRAWGTWAEIDDAFLPWLMTRYGTLLSSAARWPPAVHKVANHLARRLRDAQAERVLLVVLDGLGHAQWAHLRERLRLTIVESGTTFALVPTYTTISRQAIFAADLPVTYPESLWSTHPERRRWEAFWAGEGLNVTAVAYHRVKGRFPHDHIDFGAARAVGVVVNAVDDLMHTSELFGDAQLLANLDVWAANGFLDDLVRRAHDAGFEVWLTADHGNLECLPAGTPSEGVAIESAGKRLLRYPNRVLRDASRVEGVTWDDIPGLPSSAEPLRFAPGRLAYTNHQLSISHGGLSLDEVVVPLVRVAP